MSPNVSINGKRWVYGILHVIILILSLFLVISISVDTFNNVPFYNQPSFMKVQFWICIVFLSDFVIEFFMADNKKHYTLTRMALGAHTANKTPWMPSIT